MVSISHLVVANWLVFAVGTAVVLTAIEIYWVHRRCPADTIGNGITIGLAKAFDNRSLALRLERLNAGLETFKVLNQNATENLATLQEKTSTEMSESVSLKVREAVEKKGADSETKETSAKDKKISPSEGGGIPEFNASFGLGAADILSNQLNLVSQIFNLQTLYERSLSDRMMGDRSRLQTVLGFQVSITPPAGYEDCVAVVEVAVRMKAVSGTAPLPVSLVALMPQEKTYNAESISSSERSIEGSAVAKVLTLALSGRRGARQLFIHRDTDTVAFERDPCKEPLLLDNAAVFGWEFRPVLGRRTVSPGTRQMLAVVAIPVADVNVIGQSTLQVKSRSYWRHYDRKRQTSAPNVSWLPWKVNRSGEVKSATQELQVPNTAKIQSTLAPSVNTIKWVNSGDQKAIVIVEGSNFFAGTKVVIGGTVHREEDRTLTLKSDQALEFETSLDGLATGDAVLSGRFGPSFQLAVPQGQRPVAELDISSATIRPMRNSKTLRISVNIVGLDATGALQELTLEQLQNLPDAILFVGSEPVPMPYDYSNQSTDQSSSVKYVRVEAWISAKALAKSPSVSFRVPFCGLDYQASQPLSFSEPTVVRMGSESQNTVFRIFSQQGFPADFNIELDQTYFSTSPGLVFVSPNEYRLVVPTTVVARFQYMVLRIGKAEPYLLAIPPEDKPAPKALVDTNSMPPQVAKGSHGPVEWTGSALDSITDVTIEKTSIQTGSPVVATLPQQFAVYFNGTRLRVLLSPDTTDIEGKITLICTTLTGDKLNLPLFVTGP